MPPRKSPVLSPTRDWFSRHRPRSVSASFLAFGRTVRAPVVADGNRWHQWSPPHSLPSCASHPSAVARCRWELCRSRRFSSHARPHLCLRPAPQPLSDHAFSLVAGVPLHAPPLPADSPVVSPLAAALPLADWPSSPSPHLLRSGYALAHAPVPGALPVSLSAENYSPPLCLSFSFPPPS